MVNYYNLVNEDGNSYGVIATKLNDKIFYEILERIQQKEDYEVDDLFKAVNNLDSKAEIINMIEFGF